MDAPMIPCLQCAIWKCCPAWKQIRKEERDKVLDEIEIPFKELLKAIGTVYKLQMALPGDYNVELGEAIQVCFDKFRFIDGMIEELRQAGES
jgi:hypothetical protein